MAPEERTDDSGTDTTGQNDSFLKRYGFDPERPKADNDGLVVGDPTTQADRKAMSHWRRVRLVPASTHWQRSRLKAGLARKMYENEQWLSISGLGFENHKGNHGKYPTRDLNFWGKTVDDSIARIATNKTIPIAVAGRAGRGPTENEQVAGVANKVMRHAEAVNRIEQDDQRAAVLWALCGWVFWKTWYDENALGWRKDPNNKDAKPVKAKTGEVMTAAIDPGEIIIQPDTDFKNITWIAQVYSRSLSHIRDTWDNGKFVIPKQYSYRDDWTEEDDIAGSPAPVDNETQQDDILMAQLNVYECYWKQSDGDSPPEWHMFTFCEDVLLDEAQVVKVFPYTMAYWNQTPEGYRPLAASWDAIPAQHELNLLFRGLATRRKHYFLSKPMIPQGMTLPGGWDNSAEPLEIEVDLNGRTIEPKYLEPPLLDAGDVRNTVDLWKEQIKERLGVHDISAGKETSSARSGRHAEILANQDVENFQRATSFWRSAQHDRWLKVVELAAIHYDNGKLLETVGEDGLYQSEIFRKDMIQDVTHIRLERVSKIPGTPSERRETARHLAETGLLDPMRKAELDTYFRLLEYHDSSEDLIDEVKMARAKALKEHSVLDKGVLAPVDPYDNHEQEILVHIRAMREPSFAEKGTEARAAYISHVQTHQVWAMGGPSARPQPPEAEGQPQGAGTAQPQAGP